MYCKKLAILFLILAILFLSGCASKEESKKTLTVEEAAAEEGGTTEGETPASADGATEEQLSPMELCLLKQKIIDKDQCLNDLAVSEKDYTICQKLELLPKDDCLLEVAKIVLKKEVCDLIKTERTKDNCFNELAQGNKDYQLCLLMSHEDANKLLTLDDCLINVASKLSSTEPCLFVSATKRGESYKRDVCYYAFLSSDQNAVFCENFISEDLKAECYTKTRDLNLTMEECNSIPLIETKDTCFSDLALQKENHSICFNISKESLQQDCLSGLVSKKLITRELCKSFESFENKNNCYNVGAKELDDASYCGEIIGDNELEDKCYHDVAVDTKTPDTCSKIRVEPTGTKDKCFDELALLLPDHTVCENIISITLYAGCFLDVALKLEEPIICTDSNKEHNQNYSKYSLHDLCYKNYAISKSQLFLCEQIPNEDVKEACNDMNSAFI